MLHHKRSVITYVLKNCHDQCVRIPQESKHTLLLIYIICKPQFKDTQYVLCMNNFLVHQTFVLMLY